MARFYLESELPTKFCLSFLLAKQKGRLATSFALIAPAS